MVWHNVARLLCFETLVLAKVLSNLIVCTGKGKGAAKYAFSSESIAK